MSNKELAELGAQWVGNVETVAPRWPSGAPTDAFVTRLHVRYDAQAFPEDLNFIETADRESFQARYVLHHPFADKTSCSAGRFYRASLPDRFRQEAKNLADLTGWQSKDIEARMERTGQPISGAN